MGIMGNTPCHVASYRSIPSPQMYKSVHHNCHCIQFSNLDRYPQIRPRLNQSVFSFKICPANKENAVCGGWASAEPNIAWGGEYDGTMLVNTSTIDNWLVLFKQCTLNLTNMELVPDIKTTLESMFLLMSNDKVSEAKMLWATKILNLVISHDGKMDMFGGEDEYFVEKLQPMLASTLRSECSVEGCPQRLVDNLDKGILLR